MKTVIRTTLNFNGINTVVIRESESDEPSQDYEFAIYINDCYIESKWCHFTQVSSTRIDLTSKYTKLFKYIKTA